MIWEAIGSVLIGLVIAYAGFRLLPDRLPSRPLAMATGPAAALFGGLVAHSAVGPGHAITALSGAVVVAVTLLSLLIRPGERAKRSAAV